MNVNWKLGVLAWAAAAALVLAPAVADAQPGPGKDRRDEARKERKERRDEARKDHKEARDERKEAHGDLRDERRDLREARREGASPEQLRKEAHDVVEARKDLNKARRDARAAAKERIKARFGPAHNKVDKVKLRVELARHAQRMARLARAREVAEKNNNEEALKRIDTLMAKESARHESWIARHADGK